MRAVKNSKTDYPFLHILSAPPECRSLTDNMTQICVFSSLPAAALALITLGFLPLLFNACTVHSLPQPYIKVISPNGGEIWKEGETYQIKWKSVGVKRVCITVGIGGKEKGLITGDCNIDARKGEITWTIPKGFVSDFGISRADNVKILVFDPDNPFVQDFSDGFFIITK